MPAAIQSVDAPLEISSDGGTTYKTVVCLESYNVNGETSVTETETYCGNIVGLGQPKVTIDVNAVCETSPTVTQVSHEDVAGWWVGKTALKYRIQNPSTGTPGSNYYLQGDAYVTSKSDAFAISEVVKFSFTLTGNGIPDVTP